MTLSATRRAELLRQQHSELEVLFEMLPAPALDDLNGIWRGMIVGIKGLGWLPRSAAAGLYRVLASPMGGWRAKSFDHGTGANHWGLRLPGKQFGRYRVTIAASPVDGKPAALFDYDVSENPKALRPTIGEARVLDDGLLLCRMSRRTKTGRVPLLYFTLELGRGER